MTRKAKQQQLPPTIDLGRMVFASWEDMPPVAIHYCQSEEYARGFIAGFNCRDDLEARGLEVDGATAEIGVDALENWVSMQAASEEGAA